MATIADLEAAGYTCTISEPARDPVTDPETGDVLDPGNPTAYYSVSGHGLVVHVAESDSEQIAELADPAFLRERDWRIANPDAAVARDRLEHAGWTWAWSASTGDAIDLTDSAGTLYAAQAPADITSHDQSRQHRAAMPAAMVQLRMIRDRWLAQTDYIESFINSPTTFEHLPAVIQSAITANSTAWVAWRQALRDLPAVSGLDPVAAIGDAPHVSTQNPWPTDWPQPPTAPIIHFT